MRDGALNTSLLVGHILKLDQPLNRVLSSIINSYP